MTQAKRYGSIYRNDTNIYTEVVTKYVAALLSNADWYNGDNYILTVQEAIKVANKTFDLIDQEYERNKV